MGHRTWDIPESKLGRFKKVADRLKSKAKNLGLNWHYTVQEEDAYTEIEKILVGDTWAQVPVTYVPVLMFGDLESDIELEGWDLIGVIDFEEGGTIIRSHQDDLADRWGDTSPSRCDHCGHDRRRKQAFIVSDEDGHQRQVGSTCLDDYTGHGSAQDLAAYYASLRDLGDQFDRGWGGDDDLFDDGQGGSECIDLRTFLEVVDRVIQRDGWTSVSEARSNRRHGARSTKETSLSMMVYDEDRHRLFDDYPESDCDIEAAIEWAQDLDPDNDYEHNLKTIARSTHIHPEDHGGLAASLIHAYRQHQRDQRRQKRAETSDWIGDEGDRIEDQTLTLEMAKDLGVQRNYYGGRKSEERKWLYKFIDDEGNVIVWYTSSRKECPVDGDGEVVSEDEADGTAYLSDLGGQTFPGARYTVKDHDTYEEMKQTKVKRLYLPQSV
jgi:hypothetical protein